MAVSSIRRASQDEQEVGEAVQVDERERVHVVRTRGRECLALGPSAQCSGDVEPRGGLATTRQDEALQLGEVGVEAVALRFEPVDLLLRDAQTAFVCSRDGKVRADVEELVWTRRITSRIAGGLPPARRTPSAELSSSTVPNAAILASSFETREPSPSDVSPASPPRV